MRFRPAAYLKLAESEYFLVSLCFFSVNPRGFVSVRFSVGIFTSFKISFQIPPSRTCEHTTRKLGTLSTTTAMSLTLYDASSSLISVLFMTLFLFIFFCIRWHLWQQPALILAPTITRAGVNVYIFLFFSDERLETLRTRILSSLLVRCSNLMAGQKKKFNNFN